MENIDESKLSPEEIVDKYGKMVSSIARRMVFNREAARDAAQEVWLEILKSKDKFRGESKFSTWLYTVAKRTVLRYAKKEWIGSFRNYNRENELKPDHEIPQDRMADQEKWIEEMCDFCVTAILHCLDIETRLIYVFRKQARLSYQEISKIMEKNEAAVRQILSRASKRMNRFLNQNCSLFYPNGECRCSMKKFLPDSVIFQESRIFDKTVGHVSLLMKTEKLMPGKNYWKKYFQDMKRSIR